MEKNNEPESIDVFTRNWRVLRSLKNMGLVVVPIFTNDDHRNIDHFIVSCGMPRNLLDYGQDQG